jgi:predicted ATP-grasp superfamily ATP-dependent carboligase
MNELNNYVSVISHRNTIETLVLKKNFYQSLDRHGVPHPVTLFTEETDFDGSEEDIAFPVFIRPSQSDIFAARFHKKGFVANTRGELGRYLQLAEQHDLEVMIQEIIPGPTSNGYNIRGYFNQSSKPLVLFASQKIRQPSMFSDNCVKRSIPISQVRDACDTVVNYLTSLQYRGVFGVEFKRDPRDGRFKVLEINARSMGGNTFATACGANFVLAAYRDTLGEDVKAITHYQTGVYQINIIWDVLTLFGLTRSDHISQHQSRTLLPYVRKKVWARLSKDDIIPFIQSAR